MKHLDFINLFAKCLYGHWHWHINLFLVVKTDGDMEMVSAGCCLPHLSAITSDKWPLYHHTSSPQSGDSRKTWNKQQVFSITGGSFTIIPIRVLRRKSFKLEGRHVFPLCNWSIIFLLQKWYMGPVEIELYLSNHYLCGRLYYCGIEQNWIS